ncbi:MAG: hypothetical protein LBT46_12015 [Planctomycetaceae bacterium]|nr:hypothetical protein [Planctomycetaceae bacterium]
MILHYSRFIAPRHFSFLWQLPLNNRKNYHRLKQETAINTLVCTKNKNII